MGPSGSGHSEGFLLSRLLSWLLSILLSFLLLLIDDLFSLFLSIGIGLGLSISSLLLITFWFLFFNWFTSSTNSIAVDLTVLSVWDGTAEALTSISLTSTRWASELLLKLLIPPVTFFDSSNEILLLWANWRIIIGIRALGSIDIATVDIGASVIWACSVGIMIVCIMLLSLDEAGRSDLSIEDLVSVFIMLSLVLEPVFSLLISPWLVLIHGIVWAHGSWVQIINILVLSFIMVMLVGIDVEQYVSVEAGVVLWVIHALLPKLDGANVAEQGHHCQKSRFHFYLLFLL